ncbi:MAG: hypothetical protein ACREOI_26190 [bacterium]
MKKNKSSLSDLALSQPKTKKQTTAINFPLILCLVSGLLTLWLYFVLAQLGENAMSAVQPSGVLATSKRLMLLPLTQFDLVLTSFRQQLVIFFLGITLQLLLLAVVIRRLACRRSQSGISGRTDNRRLGWVIFAFAVLFRLVTLPQTPWLSDDIYRYLWDGSVLANGINPFRYAPEAAELAPLRDAEIFPHVNHKKVITVYPPLLQALFWLAHQLGGSVIAMKALLIAADLALVLLLFWALPKLGTPSWWTILYAWHPLAIIEIAGSGHVDGIGALFLFVAVALLALRRQEITAVCCLALAFLVKFLSVLLVPFLFLRTPAENTNWRHLFSQKSFRLLLIFVFIIFFSYLPFAGGNLISGLAVYAAKWRFNGSIFTLFYEPIHALLPDSLVIKLMVPAHWEITNEVLITRRVDLALLITKIIMAAMLSGFLLLCWRNIRHSTPGKPNCFLPFAVFSLPLFWPALTLNLLGIFFLLSPTVQPWYLLWILPLMCLVRQPGWITWSATIFLAYWILDGYARTGLWQEPAWVKWMEYGVAGLAAVAARAWKRQTKLSVEPHRILPNLNEANK